MGCVALPGFGVRVGAALGRSALKICSLHMCERCIINNDITHMWQGISKGQVEADTDPSHFVDRSDRWRLHLITLQNNTRKRTGDGRLGDHVRRGSTVYRAVKSDQM